MSGACNQRAPSKVATVHPKSKIGTLRAVELLLLLLLLHHRNHILNCTSMVASCGIHHKIYPYKISQGTVDVVSCLVPPDRANSKNTCAVTATAAATLRRKSSGTSSAAGDRFSQRMANLRPRVFTSHRPVSVNCKRHPSSPLMPVPFVKPVIRAKTPGQCAPGFAISVLALLEPWYSE